MPTIQRTDFNRQLQDKTLDVAALAQDPRMAGVNLDKVDLDGDGKISGRVEVDRLYLQVDNFDRNGTYASMDGDNSAVAEKMNALGDAAGIRPWQVLGTTIAPPAPGADGQSLADAATALVRDFANYFGVNDPWKNSDPNHALPANVRLGGLKGRWKCNLFAGNAIYNAGFEAPYYGNRGGGEYPNANQFYKWSDKYAGRFGNKVHFELKGELAVDELSGSEKKEAIAKLLATCEPGDLIMVDHMGSDVSDGGHCRVVVANDLQPDGSGIIECAQASFDAAEIQNERLGDFVNQEHIWVLKANKPRVD
jgi:hypothetical protein